MRRILLALAAAFLLAACNQGGEQAQGTAPAEAAPNDADVTFTRT
jgi:ABC-type glycerol-3-phosphate transport system substrate-binding protein